MQRGKELGRSDENDFTYGRSLRNVLAEVVTNNRVVVPIASRQITECPPNHVIKTEV